MFAVYSFYSMGNISANFRLEEVSQIGTANIGPLGPSDKAMKKSLYYTTIAPNFEDTYLTNTFVPTASS